MRRNWRERSPGTSWTEYRLSIENPPILVLAVRPDLRVHVPPIVQEAVLKIYSRVEYVPKQVRRPVKALPTTYVEPYTARYNLDEDRHRLAQRALHVEYDDILYNRILPIEEAGFPESQRTRWFYWNQRLEEVRVKMGLRPSVF